MTPAPEGAAAPALATGENDPAPGFRIAENLCRVVANDPVNAEYRLMVVDAPALALAARAGQFFHLKCPRAGEDRPFLRRPMSIYRIDRAAGQLGFLYKVAGAGTRGLATLAPGDMLDALGPLGRGFVLPARRRHVLMLARGVGLATLAPLGREARAAGAHVTAFLSARRPDLLMSRDALEAAGATVHEVTDADGSSDPAALAAAIRAVHRQRPFDFVATCGSNRLFRLARDLAREWQIPGEIAVEAYMGCGIGMCLACVVPVNLPGGGQSYRRVCIDGPVFGLEEATGW